MRSAPGGAVDFRPAGRYIPTMGRVTGYRILCGLLGIAWLAAGSMLFMLFFGYHAPGGRTDGGCRPEC